MEKTIRLVGLVREHGLTREDATVMRLCIREQLPLGLHWVGSGHNGSNVSDDDGFSRQVMFIPAIKGQGTAEQQAKWLPLAETLQIVGTYAQVETTIVITATAP